MGAFWTDISKCSEGEGANFVDFFSHRHPQQKGLQGQEYSGMGCLKIF
mgnify:FL=1